MFLQEDLLLFQFLASPILLEWYIFYILSDTIFYLEIKFESSEHMYCFRKALTYRCFNQAKAILSVKDPLKIKQMAHGHTLRKLHFQGKEPGSKLFTSSDWLMHKVPIMWTALTLKFHSKTKLPKWLISTFPGYLVEASPSDEYWGGNFYLLI